MEEPVALASIFPAYVGCLCILVVVGKLFIKNEESLSKLYMIGSLILSAGLMIHMFHANKDFYELTKNKLTPKTGEPQVEMKYTDIFPPIPEVTWLGNLVLIITATPMVVMVFRAALGY